MEFPDSYINRIIEGVKGKRLRVKVLGGINSPTDRNAYVLKDFGSYEEMEEFKGRNLDNSSGLLMTEDEDLRLMILMTRRYQTGSRIPEAMEEVDFVYGGDNHVDLCLIFGANRAHIKLTRDSTRLHQALSEAEQLAMIPMSPERATEILEKVDDVFLGKDIGALAGTQIDPEKAVKQIVNNFEACYKILNC